MNKKKRYVALAAISTAAALMITGCGKKEEAAATPYTNEAELPAAEEEAPSRVRQMTPDGPVLPYIESIPETVEEPAPEYLKPGLEHSKVAQLQARLMELGFMDNDEPTHYFGNMTESAVLAFQRQNDLAKDGVVGPATWEAIMTPDAKFYAISNGDVGEDIKRVQNRLYELGYLASKDLVTGKFGDMTEAAVKKLQELNGLNMDGKVGQQTINLLYSDDIKPNYLSYGEKSDIVLACQKRLKELGYLTTDPDGSFGNDTSMAIKQFQSRNDLVVDGYLGPSTKIALESSSAQPNGMTLGERGDSVHRVQELLNKYGYLSASNITGYYGEMTEQAVKSFQSNNGLSADGSVGMRTMAKLTGKDPKKASSGSKNNSSGGSSKKSSGGSSQGGQAVVSGNGVNALISAARSKLGSPYVYGAKGSSSFDCSGFVYWCLRQAGVKQSYLTSSGWRNVGKYTKITSFGNIQAGDIVVVKGHVGIAIGGGQVIDASSSHGKVIQRSLSSWWANNFICAWRIFG